MPGLKNFKKGILRDGWTADIDDYVIVCEWALGGNSLLAGDVTGGISAFDSISGHTLWKRERNHDGLLAIDVHPNGELFASAGQDGRILIYNALTGEKNKTIEVGPEWVEHIAWSPDGRWLAVAYSRKIIVFSSDGQKKWQSDNHPSTVSAISWSGADELAVACYGKVAIYDVVTECVQQQLEWKGSLVSMVLSPDGDIVACGSQDNSVHFWRRSTAQDSMMSGYPGKPANLAFDSSGTLLATGGSETVTVWSFQDLGPEGTRPGGLELHNRPISSLAFAPKGMRLASGSKDGSIAIWLLQKDGDGELLGATSLDTPISRLAWRPDGRAIAAANAVGKLTSWRVKN